jgi:glycosyltransferase involved in cell wall biosynthesis
LINIEEPQAQKRAASPYAPPRPYRPGARKLRVLLVSHTCQSRTEGQPKAHALAALPDIELHLLTPTRWKHYGRWRSAQVPVDPRFSFTQTNVRLAWAGPAQYFLHYYPGLPGLLRSFKPDVIDLWEEPWGLVSAQACRLRNRLLPSAKIVSETEQNIFKSLPFPFEQFRKFTLKNADYAVGRNSESIVHLRAKGYRGPAEVVPNAVDTELFRPLERLACRKKLLAALGISARDPGAEGSQDIVLAGYIGRLVEEKGLADMLDALPRCGPRTHLLFLGAGPLESELRRRAGELPGGGGGAEKGGARVHFLPARPLEELPEVMNALDVFILPSRTTARWKEQFGRVIIEAHACGTPVIGSDSGAIPDVVADAGIVVPEQNPSALAEAMLSLERSPDQARALGLRGLENVRDYFTWQRVAERMASIYQQMSGS